MLLPLKSVQVEPIAEKKLLEIKDYCQNGSEIETKKVNSG